LWSLLYEEIVGASEYPYPFLEISRQDAGTGFHRCGRWQLRPQAKLKGRKRYRLLMLEPLFRCNLACAGCGKIQYPAHILKQI